MSIYLYLEEKPNSNSWCFHMLHMHMNIVIHVSYMTCTPSCTVTGFAIATDYLH